ncbi:hypothetical protein HQ891_08615 [Lactococcus petauri]|nr:hypothetical protein [Lactococcus petauri]
MKSFQLTNNTENIIIVKNKLEVAMQMSTTREEASDDRVRKVIIAER